MRLQLSLHTAICLLLVDTVFVQAGDLSKIDPPLVKEPAYQSKAPKYALLVLGPEARTRIRLVLDGTTLYVDRNGNGDLTEDGEKVAGTHGYLLGEEAVTFEVGELHDRGRRHLNTSITVSAMKSNTGVSPRTVIFSIRMDVAVPGYTGTGQGGRVLQMAGTSDLNGNLQFTDRPNDAPFLHFGGPWTISLSERPTFRVGREIELYLALGTPGRGPGTTVYTAYEGVIPPTVYAQVEIAFPSQKPGGPPMKAIYELKRRC
jgi:hypothetical protein